MAESITEDYLPMKPPDQITLSGAVHSKKIISAKVGDLKFTRPPEESNI